MKFTADKQNVLVHGRTKMVGDTRFLVYSGSGISFTFVGKRAEAVIESDPQIFSSDLLGRVAVYINNEAEPISRICLDEKEKTYLLYESDEEKEVTVTLMKYSEAPFGMCGVKEIVIDTDKLCPPPKAKERTMEIIGDSITCGYGVEAASELVPFHTQTENPTKSYSLLTAKTLDAEVNLVSWSGNGIISHYVEETATERRIEDGLMPKVYLYTDLSGDKRRGLSEENYEKWDFASFVPQIIVINLGTNDASWCKDIQERKDHFEKEYQVFLKEVRTLNPQAKILCVLGTMDQRLVEQVEKAVKNFSKDNEEVFFMALPAQNPEDGYGADWHPCAYTQKETARLITAKIKEIMNW